MLIRRNAAESYHGGRLVGFTSQPRGDLEVRPLVYNTVSNGSVLDGSYRNVQPTAVIWVATPINERMTRVTLKRTLSFLFLAAMYVLIKMYETVKKEEFCAKLDPRIKPVTGIMLKKSRDISIRMSCDLLTEPWRSSRCTWMGIGLAEQLYMTDPPSGKLPVTGLQVVDADHQGKPILSWWGQRGYDKVQGWNGTSCQYNQCKTGQSRRSGHDPVVVWGLDCLMVI